MNCLFKHAWKIMGVVAVLLILSLTGCTEYSVQQTADGSGNNCFNPLDSGESVKGNTIDCSNETDNSVTNPLPEEEEVIE